jgi:hypothetical protein
MYNVDVYRFDHGRFQLRASRNVGVWQVPDTSTNKVATVDDEGCGVDQIFSMFGTIIIPGLRGRPAAAVAVLFSTTTLSVSVFGRVVLVDDFAREYQSGPKLLLKVENGADMIPVIRLKLRKQEAAL